MGSTSWRISLGSGGGCQHHLTVVIKVTLAYGDNGQLTLIDPEPAYREAGQSPAPVAVASSDLAPYLGQAEVWLTGHAHVIGPDPAPAVAVRLATGRRQAVIDKTLHVYGERKVGSDDASRPEPFRRLSLSSDRAVGAGPNLEGEPDPSPQIWDPGDPSRSASFSLIPPSSPARQRLFGELGSDHFDEPVWNIPKAFDWQYFQAAPEDQRCPFLRGDEWIVLDGLHSERARLELQLPKLSAHASVLAPGAGDEGHAIAMLCDGLYIDANRQRCTLRWRGCFPVIEPSRLAELRVVGAVAAADGTWLGIDGGGAAESKQQRRPDSGGQRGADRVGPEGESVLSSPSSGRRVETLVGGTSGAAVQKPEMPESARGTLLGTTGSTALRDELGIPPVEVVSKPSSSERRKPVPWKSRLALSETDASLLREQLGIPALEAAAEASGELLPDDMTGTASLSDEESVALRAKLALPFPQAKTAPVRGVALRPVYIPGAPWCRAVDDPPTSSVGLPPKLGPTLAPPTLSGFGPALGHSEGADES
jgi:hypothetical protein